MHQVASFSQKTSHLFSESGHILFFTLQTSLQYGQDIPYHTSSLLAFARAALAYTPIWNQFLPYYKLAVLSEETLCSVHTRDFRRDNE